MLVDRSTARFIFLTALTFVGCADAGGDLSQAAESANASDDVSLRAELVFWESVKDSRSSEELQAYITAYPQGRFAPLARVRLRAMTEAVARETGVGVSGRSMPPQVVSVPVAEDKTAKVPEAAGGLKPGETFRDCDICPQMTVIPAGRFQMGSGDRGAEEAPSHEVVISRDFALGSYEITAEEWDACLREGGCLHSPQPGTDGKLPIANVSWDDALGYLKWLSGKTGKTYRLPTEAEWEYAARAGTATRYWWGDEKGVKRANCNDCGSSWDGKGASPTGSFEANPFGLYDVHGNVWEWTQDCWNPSYEGAPSNGGSWMRGDCLSRVLRGGSWNLDHDYMRASRRNRYDRDVRYYVNGFRVVRELPAAPDSARTEGDAPFETAVLAAANQVLTNIRKTTPGSVRISVAIDPVVDGLSGVESVASRAMMTRILDLVEASYPQFDLKGLSASDSSYRYILIGTFTGVNKERKTAGARVAFRICLALLDQKSGKVVAWAKEFAQAEGVDITPTAFYRDSPAWTTDPSTQAYIKSCQAAKPGDQFEPLYADRIKPAAVINEAIKAYETMDYKRSQGLFQHAANIKEGEQLRTYNGLYLTSWRLGDREQAADAFGKIVEYGLNNGRLGLKFPFKSGGTDFSIDPRDPVQPDIWLPQIAKAAGRRQSCLGILGHSRRSDSEPLDPGLPLRRAEYIKRRIEAEAPELGARLAAAGRGSQENLVGSGTGDLRDELDGRMEIEVVECPSAASQKH